VRIEDEININLHVAGPKFLNNLPSAGHKTWTV